MAELWENTDVPLTDAVTGHPTPAGLKAVEKMQEVLRASSPEIIYYALRTREDLADLLDEHGLQGEQLVQMFDFDALRQQQLGRWPMDLDEEYAPVTLPHRDPLKHNDPQ